MDIFPAIIISHMGFWDVYANHEVIFIDLQGRGFNVMMKCSA
jgi:hypothetical protein